MRDDFRPADKDTLSRRAGMRCSNPGCRLPTSGPRLERDKAINVGVAAHIRGASPGGPRYEVHMNSEERAGIANGIWLCQTCAKLIDSDEKRYSVSVLETWKESAEAAAHEAIATPLRGTDVVVERAPTSPAPGRLIHRETVRLNLDMRPVGTRADIQNAAARMAIAVREDRRVQVSVEFVGLENVRPNTDPSRPDLLDAVQLAEYRRWLREKADRIQTQVETLFSPVALAEWGTYLSTAQECCRAYEAVLTGTNRRGVGLTIWRVQKPKLSGVIFVVHDPADSSKDELATVLESLRVTDVKHLTFGPGWRSADELPKSIVVDRVIPRILEAISLLPERLAGEDEERVLQLSSWEVGLN